MITHTYMLTSKHTQAYCHTHAPLTSQACSCGFCFLHFSSAYQTFFFTTENEYKSNRIKTVILYWSICTNSHLSKAEQDFVFGSRAVEVRKRAAKTLCTYMLSPAELLSSRSSPWGITISQSWSAWRLLEQTYQLTQQVQQKLKIMFFL